MAVRVGAAVAGAHVAAGSVAGTAAGAVAPTPAVAGAGCSPTGALQPTARAINVIAASQRSQAIVE
jgi:hypothetical protein